MFEKIKKRDGRIVKFDAEKITTAIAKAGAATGEFDRKIAQKLTLKVLNLAQQAITHKIPTVEEIQDVVEEVLLSSPYTKTAKAYIIYRDQHAKIREISDKAKVDLVDQYLEKIDWQVNENSNMTFSLQGLNNYISSEISKVYWLNKLYPPELRRAHINGDFHIHDLNILSVYCVGWDLLDLLKEGFKGVPGKVESKPAKHFRSALGQVVNFFYSLQGESAGAQAFSNFDTLLAPFIRYDKLSYREIKQALQEFIFNVNVPTRVGFQCISEDTEILGRDGWKKHNEVKEGDTIVTFNVDGGFLEYLPVKHVFAREYKGKMYNLKNRISDQLISPDHRIIRRKFNSERYVLEKVEDVLKLKSPFMIPIGSGGNIKGDTSVSEDVIKLIAWAVSEGSFDKSGRGDGRISIYQSKVKSPYEYEEIIAICHNLGLKYTERTQQGIGDDCNVIRFDADSTRKILNYFDSNKERGH
jgi:Oxygen-sensitive ribonucleoside-triphosphate reductase